MIEQLLAFFEEQENFVRLKTISNYDSSTIRAIYSSPEQLYIIAELKTEEELKNSWKNTAEKAAISVQSQLSGSLSHLRWDIYLLFVVTEEQVETELRKQIENNRLFFRKFVLTIQDDPIIARLPLSLQIPLTEEGILFNDKDFLNEFKSLLSDEIKNRLSENFFKHGNHSVSHVTELLIGDDDYEDSGS